MEAAQIVNCVSNYCSSFMEVLGQQKTTDITQHETQNIAIKALVEIKNELANYDADESAAGFLEKQLKDYTNNIKNENEIQQEIYDRLVMNLKVKIQNASLPNKPEIKVLNREELKEANEMIDRIFPHGIQKTALSMTAKEQYLHSEQYQESTKNLEKEILGKEKQVHIAENKAIREAHKKEFPKIKKPAAPESLEHTPQKLKVKEDVHVIKKGTHAKVAVQEKSTAKGYNKKMNIASFDSALQESEYGGHALTNTEFSRIAGNIINNNAKQQARICKELERDADTEEDANRYNDQAIVYEACQYLSTQTIVPIMDEIMAEGKKLSYEDFCKEVTIRLHDSNKPVTETFTREEFIATYETHTFDPLSRQTLYFWSPHEKNPQFDELVKAIQDKSWKDGEERQYTSPRINKDSMHYLDKSIDKWTGNETMKEYYNHLVFGKAGIKEEKAEHEPATTQPATQTTRSRTPSPDRTQEPTAPVRKGIRKTIKGWFKWSNPSGANASSVDDVVGYIPKSLMPPPPIHSQPEPWRPDDLSPPNTPPTNGP